MVDRHLTGQVGQTHKVLMESQRMGRTTQFAEVLFGANQPVGQIVTAKVTGSANNQLIAGSQ
jgi:threonylcarbamoyladenosine tRNA methylthiotransferase MtaB